MTAIFWTVATLASLVLLMVVYYLVAALVEWLWPMRDRALNGARKLRLRDVLADGKPGEDQ